MAKAVDAAERLAHRYPTRWKLRHDTKMTTADAAVAAEKLPRGSKLRRNTPYLPTVVIFNILIFVPAKALFDAARYVCKQWYDIVRDPDFVRAHCQMSTPGFLIPDSYSRDSLMIYIDSNSSNTTEIQMPAAVEVMSCFNGLVLLRTPSHTKILFHVVNPVTRVNISLPRLEDDESKMFERTAVLSMDSRGYYTVVFALDASTSYENKQIKMGLFTIGIDKAWRFIDLLDIPVNCVRTDAISFSPQPFGGFIYWYTYNYHFIPSRSSGFALDIDSETIYQFSQPDVGDIPAPATLIIIGTSLGFMLTERFIWRLWKLTDVKSGEWTELAHVDVSKLRSHFDKVFGQYVNLIYHPVRLVRGDLWLYREVKNKDLVVRYNFVSEEMVVFPMKTGVSHRTLRPHVNTLV